MYKLSDIRHDFKITTKEDVREFAKYIIDDLKVCYHPDDSFADYISIKVGAGIDDAGEKSFDDNAAAYLDTINDECFKVAGDDYYDIAYEFLQKYID